MQKKMANRTWVYNLKILIRETSFLKTRGVITENILLLKYQKKAITAALYGGDALMLLPIALKSWIHKLLPFIVSRDTPPIRNKVFDRKFYWSADHEFYSRLRI